MSGGKNLYLVSSFSSHTLTKEFIERVDNSEYYCKQSTRNRENHFTLDSNDVTVEFLKRRLPTAPLLPQAVEL